MDQMYTGHSTFVKPEVGRSPAVHRIRLLTWSDLVSELSGPQVISDCTNSPQSFNLARTWLQNCVERHTRCNPNVSRSWRPTRLLQIDRPRSGKISLSCLSQEDTAAGLEPYVTLSHCRGHGDPLKLTLETHASLLEGVLISNLPQTFQDAIVATRALGLKIIWIDSLCIFQDSHEDWMQESSLMGRVYSRALCNIGATTPATWKEECFRQRYPLLLDRTVIELSWTDRSNTGFHIILHSRNNLLPLLRRGWVVQEHVLSRRFLHFDKQQIVFECGEGYQSEMYPEVAPTDMLPLAHPLQKAATPNCLISPRADISVDVSEPYDFWARLVDYYSICDLTVATDILIAISGITKNLQATVADEYHAGIWKGQLPQCLLWVVVGGEIAKTAEPSYVAPAWSLANVKAAIHEDCGRSRRNQDHPWVFGSYRADTVGVYQVAWNVVDCSVAWGTCK